MAFSDTIEQLKNALNDYSPQEQELTNLYNTAISNAEKEAKAAKKEINQQYYYDRNQAYSDNTLGLRNTNQSLSARGLGFSGEAAQAQLNSNITLNARLGQLSRDKNKALRDKDFALEQTKSQLSMEKAAKLNEYIQHRNQLQAQIAQLELEKETADKDRQAEIDIQMEKLKQELIINDAKLENDRTLTQMNIQADKDKYLSQIQADKDKYTAQIDAEKAMNDANIQADKDKYTAQINADKEQNAANIQAEQDMLTQKLESEALLQQNQLAAEKEMQEAELAARYYAATHNSDSQSGNKNNQNSNQQTTDNQKADENDDYYTPDVSAKDLASRMVSSTGYDSINGEYSYYCVNKYLLDLINNYNLSPDYLKELVLVLGAYGYKEITEPEMRVDVLCYEAEEYFDTEEAYDKYYDQHILSGYGEKDAVTMANQSIAYDQMNYIYPSCENITEFRMCCNQIGIDYQQVNAYLQEKENEFNQSSGTTGDVPQFPIIHTQ